MTDEKKDPALKRTYSGAASGKGAVYEWEGNKDVGKGRMEIAESTIVTWDMQGPAPFVSKIMQVFIDMDNMVGKDFETGLANLKAIAEKKAANTRVTPIMFSQTLPTTEDL